MSKHSMISIATMFGRKAIIAAPTATQQGIKILKHVGTASLPYVQMAGQVAGSILAMYAGYKGAVSIIEGSAKVQGKVSPLAKKATDSAMNAGAAAVGFGAGLVHKATGVFSRAKEKAESVIPKKKAPTTVPAQESTLSAPVLDLVGVGAPLDV